MTKVSVVFGTRPEAIKLAPVIIELKKLNNIECHICVTAQHRQMLDQVLRIFNIVPDTDLNLMTPNQSLAGFTVKAVEQIDKYFKKGKPDFVLVQGDTTTVFCAALSAFYNKIPVGHVEAGLRTGNMRSPWPEEANRVLTSRLADLHFAPTEINKNNLLNEGIPDENIIVTGNTVIDALFIALEKIKNNPPYIEGLQDGDLKYINNCKFILVTGHRRENLDEGLTNICYAIKELSFRFPDIHFFYPVHLNPKVQLPVKKILAREDILSKNRIHLIPPQSYLPFIYLMYKSYFILTDSGGIQEEAPSLGKPVLVMRDTTERTEGLKAGNARLIGTDPDKIIKEVSQLLMHEDLYRKMVQSTNPYGDGKASSRIVSSVLKRIKK
ncbi:MAG: UDP-N-acetylglucosamine 2-epimerase (non-hydrolyzing) [Prolixibacteraceae bacterium]|nr:UDP-N-acetylglucosamine 2-epimerase (non-hydrolyzing) [Prolixibacteraceae bacterium]